MKTQIGYEPPMVKVIGVELEESLAQAAVVSVGVSLQDWEDGGVLGDDLGEGGDIYLIY